MTSSCSPNRRTPFLPCTTGFWIGAAPCPCIATGRTGSGSADSGRQEIVRLDSQGIVAYRCSPDSEALREDLSMAVGLGTLTLTPEGESDG